MSYGPEFIAAHANSLLKSFGLDRGWSFRINPRLRRRVGQILIYPGNTGIIELAELAVQHCTFAQVDDTLRHEMAHAIAGSEAGHGEAWKQACAITGANPSRTTDEVLPGRYQASCVCGKQHHRDRAPLTGYVYHCNACGVLVEFAQVSR